MTHDLSWSVPVARWSASHPADRESPAPCGVRPTGDAPHAGGAAALAAPIELDFIDAMTRRRLSSLSKAALRVAGACLAERHAAGASVPVRVVFASRHGELRRSVDILRAIGASQSVSPTAFSLSVMNAMTGVFSIARRDRSATTALSSGACTLGYALLEAYAQYASDPSSPVLVVYADEPADAVFGAIADEVEAGAFALLLCETTAIGWLDCSTGAAGAAGATDGADGDCAAEPRRYATQSEAVRHALTDGSIAAWQGEEGSEAWRWGWRDV